MLVDRVNAASHSPAPAGPPCVLKLPSPCCQGDGFQLITKGPFIAADLCECVKKCPACQGLTMLTEGSYSRPCRKLTPKTICKNLNLAGFPSRYLKTSFENFTNYSGNADQVVPTLRTWAGRYSKDNKTRGLILNGPVGVGKTHLIIALGLEAIRQGLTIRFVDFFQLLAELKQGFTQGQSELTILAPLIEVELLIIDELGKGRNSEWEMTILDQLIMGRYNQGRTVLGTTNCALKNATLPRSVYNFEESHWQNGTIKTDDFFGTLEDRVGQRIYSRLEEMCEFVELSGHDFRRNPSPPRRP